jgi:hypothetical protein
MKKILLILFISFAFSGSANANSIDGAFGYKLGESYKKEDKSFVPKKPLPYLDQYHVSITPISKKIYLIRGSIIDKNKLLLECDSDYSSSKKLLYLLQKKYGQFKKTVDKVKYFKLGNANWGVQDLVYIHEQGERRIVLECNESTKIEDYVTSGHYSLQLKYYDSDLILQANKEEQKLKVEEESEYDI